MKTQEFENPYDHIEIVKTWYDYYVEFTINGRYWGTLKFTNIGDLHDFLIKSYYNPNGIMAKSFGYRITGITNVERIAWIDHSE